MQKKKQTNKQTKKNKHKTNTKVKKKSAPYRNCTAATKAARATFVAAVHLSKGRRGGDTGKRKKKRLEKKEVFFGGSAPYPGHREEKSTCSPVKGKRVRFCCNTLQQMLFTNPETRLNLSRSRHKGTLSCLQYPVHVQSFTKDLTFRTVSS